MRHGIRQSDLAAMLGYEQSYVSALEIGTKGPPTEEFVSKLTSVLELNDEDRNLLAIAVRESQRKYVIPVDASAEAFRMYRDLWDSLVDLHPTQMQIIRDVIRLKKQLVVGSPPEQGRIQRRRKEVAET
jgi:transcriptional regulator with XRE-family HTH domain